MKRTTFRGTWVLVALAAAGLWYGLYWFYRVPPAVKQSQGFEFSTSGPMDGGIPSITAPVFESTAEADQYLNDEGFGLDVEVDGEHKFYPYQILIWHEAVNDMIGDVPVIVTYAPLTDTGMAFERSVNGEVLAFSVSGSLWNNNLVLLDEKTGSRWIQLYGRAVEGEMTGTELRPALARTMAWASWKSAFPNGDVLSRETGVSRDYTRNPYDNYVATPAIWFPITSVDARMNAKSVAYVVSVGSERVAYPEDALRQVGKIQETVAGVPIEVRYDEKLETAFANRLEPDGNAGDELVMTRGFWFAWSAAYPGIRLYETP